MSRVLPYIAAGEHDRNQIALELNLTAEQVTKAIHNLKVAGLIEVDRHRTNGIGVGRSDTIYRIADPQEAKSAPVSSSIFAGAGSIFRVRVE